MVLVDSNFNIVAQYDKKKLVPFGEFLPLENFLNKIGMKKITSGYSSFSNGTGESWSDDMRVREIRKWNTNRTVT